MVKGRKIACAAVGAVLSAACATTLFLPLPKTAGRQGEVYRCVWDDGTVTSEGYAEAFSMLEGVGEDGVIELKRGTHVGRIEATEDFSAYCYALSEGSLTDLLLLGGGELSRIQRAALFREYGGAVYYSVDEFHYTGEGFVRENCGHAEEVVLLSGTLPAGYLAEKGATKLRLASGATLTADKLIGSKIAEISAPAPYKIEQDGLYLTVAGQRRLVAALPKVRSLTVAAADYMDQGALLACTSLAELTLPYAGNAARSAGTGYDGTFAWLFAEREGYRVPESLKRVKILGGKLISHCFYACPRLEEVDACGLAAEDVSIDAFADMVGWKRVHSPKSGLILQGVYRAVRMHGL